MNLQAKKQPYEETRKGSQSIVGGQPRQDGLPVGHSENWGAKAAHTHEKWDRGSYLDPLSWGNWAIRTLWPLRDLCMFC